MNGNDIILDIDADSKLVTSVDDVLTIELGGIAEYVFSATSLSIGANYMQINDITDPGAPPSSDVRIYFDSADSFLKARKSTGIVNLEVRDRIVDADSSVIVTDNSSIISTINGIGRFQVNLNDVTILDPVAAGATKLRLESDDSAAVGTIFAQIDYIGEDNLANDHIYAVQTVLPRNITNGSETGEIGWWVAKGGSAALDSATKMSWGMTESDTEPMLKLLSDDQEINLQIHRDGGAGGLDNLLNIEFYADDSANNKDLMAGIFVDVTNGTTTTETGRIALEVKRSGSSILEALITMDGGNGLSLGNGSGSSVWDHIGFYGTSPIQKPTVSGSRGGNAALASLLTQLANLGLITDSTGA
jgi:hypothetical protein